MLFAKYEISVEMHNETWNIELTFTFYIHLPVVHSKFYNTAVISHSNNDTVENFLLFLSLSKEGLHLYFLFPLVQIIFTYIVSD